LQLPKTTYHHHQLRVSPPYTCLFCSISRTCGSFLSLINDVDVNVCQHTYTRMLTVFLYFCLRGFERSVGGCRSLSLRLLFPLRSPCVFVSTIATTANTHFIRSYLQDLANQTATQHYNLRCVYVSVCVCVM
jgi:hypothetical protein